MYFEVGVSWSEESSWIGMIRVVIEVMLKSELREFFPRTVRGAQFCWPGCLKKHMVETLIANFQQDHLLFVSLMVNKNSQYFGDFPPAPRILLGPKNPPKKGCQLHQATR